MTTILTLDLLNIGLAELLKSIEQFRCVPGWWISEVSVASAITDGARLTLLFKNESAAEVLTAHLRSILRPDNPDDICPFQLPSGTLTRPIFILGAPFSGSAMLCRGLGQAKMLWRVPLQNSTMLERLTNLSAVRIGSHRLTEVHASQDVEDRVRSAYLSVLRDGDNRSFVSEAKQRTQGPVRFVDMSPRNMLRVPFLNALFPDCYFVLIHREAPPNLRDLVDGWKAGLHPVRLRHRKSWCFVVPPGWEQVINRPIEELAAFQWRVSHSCALDDLAAISSSRWCSIRCEAFAGRPIEYVRRICEFADVPLEDDLQKPLAELFEPIVSNQRVNVHTQNTASMASILAHLADVRERLARLPPT